jgi:hypothetical protein
MSSFWPGKPRQVPVDEHEERGAPDREEAEAERPLRREGRRRDEHGGEEQHRERVLEPPGQVEQGRKLQDVEGKQGRGGVVGQPVARREADPQGEIDPGRHGDHQDRQPEWQRKAEAELDHGDRRRLAGHREPAQPDQGVEPQAPGVPGEIGRRHVHHGARIGPAGRASKNAAAR